MTSDFFSRRFHSVPIRLFAFLLLGLGLTAAGMGEDYPDQGFFLIASENMQDPRFKESVVLVTRHHLGETIGVVVNKPTDMEVSKLFPQSGIEARHAKQIYYGGPVAKQSLLFLIRSKNQPKASLRIFDNVFLSADRKVLAEVLRHPKPFSALRVFSGYAGWKPGQLESEIEQGVWHLMEADTETLFKSDPAAMWHTLIKNVKGGRWVLRETKHAKS